jgi:uncharacterized protein YrzB (UPF0473 family)
VLKARQDLAMAQAQFFSSQGNTDCRRKEKECFHLLMSLLTAEEKLFKQKSRIQWLYQDGNNSFFHNLNKVRNSSNLIKVLMDNEENSIYDMQKISNMAVNFYKQLLGHSSHEFSSEKADRVYVLSVQKEIICGYGCWNEFSSH